MAKSASVYARIDPDLKEQAEAILAALGIPTSNAIDMFFKQIVLKKRTALLRSDFLMKCRLIWLHLQRKN